MIDYENLLLRSFDNFVRALECVHYCEDSLTGVTNVTNVAMDQGRPSSYCRMPSFNCFTRRAVTALLPI